MFSQSGNDSKWFLKKSFFKIGMWHSRPPRDPPPPFMGNTILNFHFDYWHPSLRYLDGGQLVHYVGNYIETTISNQSWVPKAWSETLRAPQNIPARLHPCPTILLGLVAKNLSIASTALVRSYFYDKLLTRCNHLQKYLDKDHVRISWQEKL